MEREKESLNAINRYHGAFSSGGELPILNNIITGIAMYALRKRIPMAVETEYDDDGEAQFYCPCGERTRWEHQHYCAVCGQSLLWSDEEL